MGLRHGLAVCAMLLASAGPAAGAEGGPRKAALRLREAAAAAERGDCATAIRPVEAVIGARDFPTLPDELRLASLHLAAVCAVSLNRDEEAYRHALAATAFVDSDDFLWRIRLGSELDAGKFEAAVRTVERMAQGRGAALGDIPLQWFGRVEADLRKKGETALRRRLLAVVASDTYQPAAPAASTDWLRYRYAALLQDAGDRAAADAIVHQLTLPGLVLQVSLDPRFRHRFPADPDLRAVTEREVALMRAIAAAHPDHIEPVNEVATYLRALGRPKEAIAALEAIRPAVTGTATLKDRDEQALWWWDQLSRAQAMLGDYPAAFDALARGAALTENGSANVSQVINLSQLQLEAGQLEESLRTLKPFDGKRADTSPYGLMQVTVTRACAHARLNRRADAQEDIAYVRAHAQDDPEGHVRLLLCLGDLDGAAAATIARLGDADQRQAALRQLSRFDPPVVARPADPVETGLAALKARADVQAAASRAGGTRTFNVQDTHF